MLETISLIASAVSALTAVTTSLRALGKAAEHSRLRRRELRSVLLLYLVVTVIWSVIAMVFAAPVLYKGWLSGNYTQFYPGILLFLVMVIVLWLIWKKILS